jgi:hypothetical protein
MELLTQNLSNKIESFSMLSTECVEAINALRKQFGYKNSRSHSDFLKKVRIICEALGIDEGNISSIYLDSRGREKVVYQLNEKLAMMLIADEVIQVKSAFYDDYLKKRDLIKQLSTPTPYLDTVKMFKDEILPEISQVVRKELDNAFRNELPTHLSKYATKRKEFSEISKRLLRSGTGSLGYCPCCQKSNIDFDSLQVDHFRDHQSNALENGWAICVDCHSSLTNSSISRSEKEADFTHYHNYLRANNFYSAQAQYRLNFEEY